jgi:hypothetical protein
MILLYINPKNVYIARNILLELYLFGIGFHSKPEYKKVISDYLNWEKNLIYQPRYDYNGF